MDYERYYLDLLDMMNSSFKKIASGKFSEMAESFSMMMIKVEARDFQLKQLKSELKEPKG